MAFRTQPRSSDSNPASQTASRGALIALALTLVAITAAACVRRSERAAAPREFRVMTWNIHHGEGLDGRVDLERIAALIRSEKPDIVGLQEVDKGVTRTQGRDLPAEIAALTGMTPVFSKNINFQGGEYGNATLSRWPVVVATNHHYAMLREGEQRGLLQTTIDLGGRPLGFWNTHIDHRRDDSERVSNVQEIRRHLATSLMPVVLVGDFNDFPDSRVHRGLLEIFRDSWLEAGEGDGATFPAEPAGRRIDYIWIQRDAPLRARSIRVVKTDASDHWAVVADLVWDVK
jgi:endonuclease/exonuclease/phosphatase family metal-dependent hydrolase